MRKLLLTLLCAGSALVGVAQAQAEPRVALTVDQLRAGVFDAPVDLSAFAAPADANAPRARFEGRLRIDVDAAFTGYTSVFDDGSFDEPHGDRTARLPAFDFAFIQDGGDLIPVTRRPSPSAAPGWEIMLQPGRVWREAGDQGWTRAALPFTLQEWNANCTHNGVLTFVFRGRSMSNVAYEIASETCQYRKFDAWGIAPARYTPERVSHGADVVAAYRAEAAARMPTRPIAELADVYADLDPAQFRLPTRADPPTYWGVVVDGVNYRSPCPTRHGDYPYCDVLVAPSYSTAKSLFAAIALMRLEVLHPGIRSAHIGAYVPTCGRNPAWADVTFESALDMATGVYGSGHNHDDETAGVIESFFLAPNYSAKITYACTMYPRQAAPETTWVYHTTDTFTLGAAMQAYVRSTDGADADIYRHTVRPLWQALHLSPVLDDTMRTYDASAQPLAGLGLFYTPDDIARLARWVADGALIDGQPVLDQSMLNAALQRDPNDRGLEAGGANFRYRAGFWARNIAPAIGCAGPVWVPYMTGYGGISVVLLPNDVQFYYFSDSGNFDWTPAAVAANRIRGMCS